MTGKAYHIISKEIEKVRNSNFNLGTHSLLHTDTRVLTSHVGKTAT